MRSLGESSEAWNSATERRLDAMAKDLQNLLHSNAKSEEACAEKFGSFAVTLSKFADEATNRGTIRTILTTLNFSQIKARQNEIPKAHQNTFEWIFNESLEGNLSKWLHPCSDGVFWITGKPGSGKSTLMKLLSGDQRTLLLAKSWVGPKPLVVASHFFWNAGKPLQKSQEGLLRTLLFQILVQCPEVIPEVCSERYANPLQDIEPWGVEELSRAFSRIQQIQELPCRVLMLVDGLDEYSGDVKELTTFLHAVAKSSEIRVCCASRAWPEFSKAFGSGTWKVQVHQLTKADIRSYIEDHLGQHDAFAKLHSKDESSTKAFMETIAEKAEGVLFWVFLVIKSILRGLDNLDDIGTLRRRLDELPSDLNAFFERMMDSIENVYKQEAHTAFLLLLCAKAPLPVDVLLALDQLDRRNKKGIPGLFDAGLFNEALAPYLNIPNFDAKSLADRTTNEGLQKQDQIVARCRDLIQLSRAVKTSRAYAGPHIGFIHRTVVDFLEERGALKRLESLLPHSPRLLLAAAYTLLLGSLQRIDEENSKVPNDPFEIILRIFYQIQEATTEEVAADGVLFCRLTRTIDKREMVLLRGGLSEREAEQLLSLCANLEAKLISGCEFLD
ncbi:hypothetical protein CGMCC3_g14616 [Colletotrichum fructicola]|uniref:Nephrocystin 3-like N-terminal domain-containing protein n=2 Tax=Colletotrichum fructicola (strain Nara gc5) TaxID=1213859 RepID=A0A7J6JE92_COLFN|nr:uncharacterized protein CGMCC3_g14616 [Colletotrichum fructicola]KAE9569295.1 hypothetical protein CGMCC3_g14616 [Colletotrichum fructicola]KAF4488362.1 hypothetical protein CGGC5_v004427 [Colletotrichum fructicola Nara gc5]